MTSRPLQPVLVPGGRYAPSDDVDYPAPTALVVISFA